MTAPWGIAVDATTVYVAGQGQSSPSHPLLAVPLAGGEAAAVATGSNWTVAIDDSRMYWSDGSAIRSCRKQDCADSTVSLAPSSQSLGIAVDATSVYWAENIDGTIKKVDKNGGAASVLASSGSPYELTVDATDVYWTGYDLAAAGGTVMKVAITGGTPVQLAAGALGETMGIVVDAHNVYFTTSDGRMMQVSKDGGAVHTLSTALGNDPWGIATDGKNLYAVSETLQGSGSIVRVPVGGGATKVIASGQVAPVGIAVDDTCVYWTDVEGGTLMRMAK